jgi:hypothetical protein
MRREMVRIAIFHSAKNRDTALNAGKLIESHITTLMYHETERIWDKKYCRNPVALLENVSHALFVYSSSERDVSSFLFLSGYCLGKGIRILVLETSETIRIPDNCRQFGVILKPDLFEEYMAAEKLRYERDEKQSWAKQILVERGIPCFEQNFLLMIESGDSDAVSLFIDAGFSPSVTDAKGIPALSIAVRAQNIAIARLLIDSGADVNTLSGDRLYSPLMDAAQKGDLAMAELLLEHGAKPDLKSKDGQTALVICAGRGDVAASSLLAKYGADPEIKDNLGMSASGYAKLFRNEKLMALFNIQPA